MRLSATVALLAALASTLTSCGGGESGEEERVVAAIEAMQRDMAAGNVRAVCAALTDRPRRQIGSVGHGRRPTTCERDVRELVLSSGLSAAGEEAGLRRTAKPDVVAVAIDPGGDRAVATLTLGAGPFRVELARERDRWKLDDFFGAVAPPPKDLR